MNNALDSRAKRTKGEGRERESEREREREIERERKRERKKETEPFHVGFFSRPQSYAFVPFVVI